MSSPRTPILQQFNLGDFGLPSSHFSRLKGSLIPGWLPILNSGLQKAGQEGAYFLVRQDPDIGAGAYFLMTLDPEIIQAACSYDMGS